MNEPAPAPPRPARFQFGLGALMASVLWLGFCGSLVAIFGSELRWLGGIGIFAWVISVWLALCFDLPEQNDFPDPPRSPRLQFSLRGLMASVLWLGFCAAMVVLGCRGPAWLCGLGFFGAVLWSVRVWFTYVNDRPIPWSPPPESRECSQEPRRDNP